MRIQLIFMLLFSTSLFASSDKEMTALFMNYDAIMNGQKLELIDEVFSRKFLSDVGGKEEFIANIKELPKADAKSLKFSSIKWKKGVKDEIFFAKRLQKSGLKGKEEVASPGSSFMVIKESGKLKINGTISDDH